MKLENSDKIIVNVSLPAELVETIKQLAAKNNRTVVEELERLVNIGFGAIYLADKLGIKRGVE
jgi:hypothetical protein